MPRGGERFGAWYDPIAADMAVAFFRQHLRHTEAEWAGRPFVPAVWQSWRIIRPLFGWKREDGTRLIRTVYLEIPRKNGKTELAAGVSLIALMGDGEMGGQVYSMAVDEDQAKIVFNKAATMVGSSPSLSRELEVFKPSIYCPALMASFRPLSKAPGSKHGFSPSGAIADEIHAWASGELYQVVHDGMAARRQPIELITTTAGLRGFGFGWEMHDYALKVLDGIIEDPSFLAVIFAADADDDWTDEATWAKANPGLGVSPKLEFLRAQCAKAQSNPRLENNFRRFHLNQWTEQTERWLPMAAWDECGEPVDPKSLEGRECYGGLDLSRKIDVSAFVLAFPPLDEGERWKVLAFFWVPEERIDVRVKRDKVPYDLWVKEGLIKATSGNVVDYRVIFNDILDLGGRFVIREIGFDPWNATQLSTDLSDEGFTMVEIRQGFRSLSEPSKFLEGLVLQRTLAHGGNKVLRWMASNVAIRSDPNENIAPDKDKSTERIDGITATIVAMARAIFHDAESGPSVYETQGFFM